MKDSSGFAHARGQVGNGTSSSTAFTLPPGYRPSQTVMFACGCWSGSAALAAFVLITTGGVATCYYAAGASYMGLDTITFLAEN